MQRSDLTDGQVMRGYNPANADPMLAWANQFGSGTWRGQTTDEDGKVKGKPDRSSVENAMRALERMEYRSTIKLNEWTGKIEMLDKPHTRTYDGETDLTQFTAALEYRFGGLGYLPTTTAVDKAVQAIAKLQKHNPRVDQLRAVIWDEHDRWRELATAMCQDKDDEVAVEICKLIVRGVVVRAVHPGAEFHYCPILYSPHQGAGKTNFLKIISHGYYGELDRGLFVGVGDTQRTITERLRGRSVVELGEINGINGQAMNRLKSFITSRSLNGVRWVFGRNAEDWPLTAIVVGTTNSKEIVADTEARRFPVLTIPQGENIDNLWIADNRAQLYAQALHEYEVIMLELVMDAQNMQGGGLIGGKMNDAIGMIYNEDEEVSVRIPERFWEALDRRSVQHREVSPLEEFLRAELEKYAEDEVLLGTDLLTFAKQKVGKVGNRDFSESMKVCGWGKWLATVGDRKLNVWGRPGATKQVELRPDPMSLIPQ